ncbi:MAG: TraR/DksA C4-type zinc finger protein [Nitrospira sp.]|nr:TraR/DksA C4-type zinc finger protein [Nitrospira sp.]
MALTTQPKYPSRQPKGRQLPLSAWSPELKRTRLREELTRQRTLLLAEWDLSLNPLTEPAHFSDPADRASSDFDQNVTFRIRKRVIARLKRIERALLLLRTKHYGTCRRCRKAIPDARLAVQPDTRFCVPCLALMESRALRN